MAEDSGAPISIRDTVFAQFIVLGATTRIYSNNLLGFGHRSCSGAFKEPAIPPMFHCSWLDDFHSFSTHQWAVEDDGFELSTFAALVETELFGELSENWPQFPGGFPDMRFIQSDESGLNEDGFDFEFLDEVEDSVLGHEPEGSHGHYSKSFTAIFNPLLLVVAENGSSGDGFDFGESLLAVLEQQVEILYLVPFSLLVRVGVDGDGLPVHWPSEERQLERFPDSLHNLSPGALVHVRVELGGSVRGMEVCEADEFVALGDREMNGEDGIFAARDDTHEFHLFVER